VPTKKSLACLWMWSRSAFRMACECFCRNTCESSCFLILELFHCLSEFVPGDGVIELPYNMSLLDIFKNCGICGVVTVEDIMIVSEVQRNSCSWR
jgi:hypothetical protein